MKRIKRRALVLAVIALFVITLALITRQDPAQVQYQQVPPPGAATTAPVVPAATESPSAVPASLVTETAPEFRQDSSTPALQPPASSAPVVTRAPASAAPPPALPAAPSCHPLSRAGNCYRPGEYCRASDHGVAGTDAEGNAITCEDNDGWRWEA